MIKKVNNYKAPTAADMTISASDIKCVIDVAADHDIQMCESSAIDCVVAINNNIGIKCAAHIDGAQYYEAVKQFFIN